MLPSFIVKMRDRYCSLIALEGSMIDSRMSRALKRLPTAVRSGPDRAGLSRAAATGEEMALGAHRLAVEPFAPGEIPAFGHASKRGLQISHRPHLNERAGGDRHGGLRHVEALLRQGEQRRTVGLGQLLQCLVADAEDELPKLLPPRNPLALANQLK